LQRAPLVQSEQAVSGPSIRRTDVPTSEETAFAPVMPIAPAAAEEEATQGEPPEPTAPSGRPFRRAIGVLGVAVVAVVAGAVFMTRRADSSSPSEARAMVVAAPSAERALPVDTSEADPPPAPALQETVGSSRPSSKPPPRVRSVRGTMPVTTTGAVPKKTHQVDRNGVPILD
jgi:hypothetical protein